MPQPVTILVGTMTGTAEMVAQEMADVLQQQGHRAEVLPMDNLGPDVFGRDGVFLICTSTYGQGDVPDNAMAFFARLEQERPDLSRCSFGVFGLGDRTYTDTFCFGPKRFAALLEELGARRIGDVFCHDASAGTVPEEIGASWVVEWIATVDAERESTH
ncbi:MAG TPA: flavodoxin domain-containing protein [Alphaproteobacteria bacterium]